MSTFFNDMRIALEKTLLALGEPVAWENTSYEPTPSEQWIRPTILPGESVQASSGENGRDYHQGIFQCDCFIPAGKSADQTLPDEVADAFKRGSVHTHNDLTVKSRSVSVGNAIGDQVNAGSGSSAWYVVPVVVRYFAYTTARS